MMGWMSRNSSSSSPAGFMDKKRGQPLVEHGAAFSLLEDHFLQTKNIIDNPTAETASDALTVISHFTQMISFLRLTRNEDPEQNCKKFWVKNKCSDIVLQWLYSLQNKGILLENEDEKKLVQTLESLCEVVGTYQDGELLGYSSSSNNEGGESSSDNDMKKDNSSSGETCIVWDGACSLCSLLLDFFGSSDPSLGPPARNAFLILIQLSEKFPQLEKCFLKETGLELTNVVISGLSACFAQLPTFYAGTDEQIEPFRTQLQFVDRVVQSAPSTLSKTQFADCFSNTFLHAVILPALTQDDGNRSLHSEDDQFVTTLHEEIAIVTNYLRIVCEHLTHPLLVKSLMMFILNKLLPVLLQRMNHQNVSVTVSTLGLLSTLLNLHCEDLWHELILRHLMPLRHLMVSQRKSVLPVIDHQDSSLRFLSLIPSPILEVMGPEAISYHYSQYLNNENNHIPFFLNQEFSFPPPHTTSTKNATATQASVFPHWKYKYDGTDEMKSSINKTSPNPSIQQQEPPSSNPLAEEQEIEDRIIVQPTTTLHSLEQNTPAPSNDITIIHPLSNMPDMMSDQEEENFSSANFNTRNGLMSNNNPTFTTISLQPTTDEQFHSLGTGSNPEDPSTYHPSSVVIGSDGYGSLESDEVIINGSSGGTIVAAITTSSSSSSECTSSDAASFGPFLDILLNHLKNLGKLPPDMILCTTEIISILARSRVPLVTSILLDTHIILQPSYLSFPLLLNGIRVEFEKSLRNHCHVLAEVWTNFCKESAAAQLQDQSFQNSLSSSSSTITSSTSMNFIHSLSNSLDSSFGGGDNSFTENIKKKINSSSLLNNVFHRKSSAGVVGSSGSVKNYSSPTSSPAASVSGRRSLNGSLEINESALLNDSLTQSPTTTTNLQNYRHRTGQNNAAPESPLLGGGNNHQSTDSLRIAATRAIYFAHWLLELAAVSQQYCWKRPPV